MTKPTYEPIIRTQADLEDAWRHLMGPWGYGRHSLWLMVILDDKPLPQLTEVEGQVEPLDPDQRRQFAAFLHGLAADLGPEVRYAMLRTRPGRSRIDDTDRAWARALYDACALAEVPCEVVHLGTKDRVQPLPPDEVMAVSA